jgi:hypothetical protein
LSDLRIAPWVITSLFLAVHAGSSVRHIRAFS